MMSAVLDEANNMQVAYEVLAAEIRKALEEEALRFLDKLRQLMVKSGKTVETIQNGQLATAESEPVAAQPAKKR
jgi:acetylglutamate kinase